jgi:hypothetical protein
MVLLFYPPLGDPCVHMKEKGGIPHMRGAKKKEDYELPPHQCTTRCSHVKNVERIVDQAKGLHHSTTPPKLQGKMNVLVGEAMQLRSQTSS